MSLSTKPPHMKSFPQLTPFARGATFDSADPRRLWTHAGAAHPRKKRVRDRRFEAKCSTFAVKSGTGKQGGGSEAYRRKMGWQDEAAEQLKRYLLAQDATKKGNTGSS